MTTRFEEFAEALKEKENASEDEAWMLYIWKFTSELMDDEIREEVHNDISPCTDIEFLREYMKRHEAKFGDVFKV